MKTRMLKKLAAIALAGLVSVAMAAVYTANAQEVEDAATGGGWIVGTPSGGFANFGFVGGIQDTNVLFGHLNYVDHDADLHVVSTAVTGYTVVDVDTREIVYDVLINGEPGTATVEVTDLGEPGWDDTFEITLSTGYTASGDLGGDRPGGGNIKIHAED